MHEDSYFGTYARFETASKKEAAVLIGADNLVGDQFSISFKTEGGIITAWIVNRFGGEIGYLDPDTSRRLSILNARDFTLVALLSFVAFSSTPEPGHYWGQVALVGYDKSLSECMPTFLSKLGKKMQDGGRPDISLSKQGIQQLVDNKGDWLPQQSVAMPAKESNTVILKSHRKFSEQMIEQGRKGNIGCYIVSWAFLLAVVAAIIFGLKACGAF